MIKDLTGACLFSIVEDIMVTASSRPAGADGAAACGSSGGRDLRRSDRVVQALTSPSVDVAAVESFSTGVRVGRGLLRICLVSLFLVAAWFWPVGNQYVPLPPSFPCATATLATEKTICADPLLEKIDADHAVYFQDNLGAAINFQAAAIENKLKKSEADFIAARNRCGRDRWCMELQYLHQDMRIADMSGEPHRLTTAPQVYLDHYVGAYLKAWLHRLMKARTQRP
ncbi:MAG TPA: hypothetical protein VID71_10715 [Steroidobacteraceae bacterium]|jgi:hypothetical protein